MAGLGQGFSNPCFVCRFTPSLRPLRQQAFLLQFPPTLPSRLVQRLQEACGGPSRPGGVDATSHPSEPPFFGAWAFHSWPRVAGPMEGG